jgi:hypothetical protein
VTYCGKGAIIAVPLPVLQRGHDMAHGSRSVCGADKGHQDFFLCGLVVGVPGYRSIGPGFDSRRYHIF